MLLHNLLGHPNHAQDVVLRRVAVRARARHAGQRSLMHALLVLHQPLKPGQAFGTVAAAEVDGLLVGDEGACGNEHRENKRQKARALGKASASENEPVRISPENTSAGAEGTPCSLFAHSVWLACRVRCSAFPPLSAAALLRCDSPSSAKVRSQKKQKGLASTFLRLRPMAAGGAEENE